MNSPHYYSAKKKKKKTYPFLGVIQFYLAMKFSLYVECKKKTSNQKKKKKENLKTLVIRLYYGHFSQKNTHYSHRTNSKKNIELGIYKF